MGLRMDVTDEAEVNAGVASVVQGFGRVDILVSNAGIQIVHPLEAFPFAEWKRLLAIHLDGAFQGGFAAQICLRHGQARPPGLARVVAKEGAAHGVRANVIGPGFVKTPLVEKQIPEQAQALGISEQEVVEKIMLGVTVDKTFTTSEDVAEIALLFAAFPTNAVTGQSMVVSHGWNMS